MECGQQCVAIPGTTTMPRLYAGSWGTLLIHLVQVSGKPQHGCVMSHNSLGGMKYQLDITGIAVTVLPVVMECRSNSFPSISSKQ